MITLPKAFHDRMQNLLGNDYGSFYDSLQQAAPVSIRHNRKKTGSLPQKDVVAWCEAGRYLPERPVFTLDPLLHAGTYYVQEASSMFMEQAAALIAGDHPLHVLDLCAAPGGKSTHLVDCLPAGSLLVSNEVIRHRVNVLAENLCKWGNPHVAVTHNDPKDFAALPSFFDVVLIDAPCSGEGMFRKDPQAVNEWSVDNVQHCAERQRRIVGDVWGTLREGGWLIYSTCTYNREENENNVQRIIKELGAELVRIPLQPAWNITESDYGYRFYPHKTRGEGFFISLLRKKSAAPAGRSPKIPRPAIAKNVPQWLSGDFITVQHDAFLQTRPAELMNDIALLQSRLRVLQAGVQTGEIKGKDIIPHTAIALCTALRPDAFPCEEVDLNDALHFLHRDNISLKTNNRGYQLITFQGQPLGFVKNLGNRCNNLYPNNWRIRMDIL